MNDLVSGIRFAVRSLSRQPRFFVVGALTVALGIGLTTSIFSVVNAVLLRPLPYPDQDRVVEIHNVWEGSPRAGLSPAEFLDYEVGSSGSFEAFGVYAFGAANLTGDGEPMRVRGAFATAGMLPALGVTPTRGRNFTEREDRNVEPVVLISHALWQTRFGGDPDIVGRTIQLDNDVQNVIGVLPAGFQVPTDLAQGRTADFLAPLGIDPATVSRGSHFLNAVGRLRPGVSIDAADANLSTVAARFVAAFPDDYPNDMRFGVRVRPLTNLIAGSVRSALLILLGAAGFVLLIVCTTVANLVLVRVDGRRRELAVRAAMGASRSRLIANVLFESLMVAGAGGVVGLLLAWWGCDTFVALAPPGMPRLDQVAVDARVLTFALATTLATGLVFGILPTISLSDLGVAAVLRSEGGAVGRARTLLRKSLVVGQVALALMLLVGAGLLGQSLLALRGVDPGFRIASVLSARLSLSSTDYPDDADRVQFYRQLEDRLRAIPGVAAAGAVTNLPLATSLGDLNFRIEGRPVPEGEVSPRADWQVVTPGYFGAMGLRLLRGRVLGTEDTEDAAGAVVINRTLADRYWPDEDPLGKRFELGGGAGPGWVTVVGIVADVRHGSLADPPVNQMYLPHAQFRFWNGGSAVSAMTLVLQAEDGDPGALTSDLRAAVGAIDPDLALAEVRPMTDVFAASLGREQVLVLLSGSFAFLALVLGALGIYGVVANDVTRRTREIGVRVALGARTGTVVGMVVRRGGRLAFTGIGLGMIGALVVTRALQGLLFQVTPYDPITLAGVAVLLAAVAIAASWLPARRAARIDPMEALRAE
jgi:putative ABC transport system permease protein